MNLGRSNQSVDFQGSERTADYSKLLEYGLDSKVADKLDDIYKVKHLYKTHLWGGSGWDRDRAANPAWPGDFPEEQKVKVLRAV